MILTPSYDQEFCYQLGLCSDSGHLIDLIIKLPSWAQKHQAKDGDYYFIDYGKILKELPVNFKSKSKITKLLKPLMESGLVENIRVGRSLYLRASKEVVYFWKKTKKNEAETNRSKNRTFYIWNDFVLNLEHTVLKIEPISTPAISTPIISTPRDDSENRSKNETGKEPAKSTQTWNAYSRAYLERYPRSPYRDASVNTLLCKFVDKVGKEDAPMIAAYYISLNDQWYVKKGHDVATLLQNAQSIANQWAAGTNQTSLDYRNQERTSNNQSVQQKIEQRINAGEL